MSLISVLNNGTALTAFEHTGEVLQCILIASLLYEVNGKRINWLRCILHAAAMSISIIVPGEYIFGLLIRRGLSKNALTDGILFAFLQIRNPIWFVLCVLSVLMLLKLQWKTIKNQLVVMYCAYSIPFYTGVFIDQLFWALFGIMNINPASGGVVVLYIDMFMELLVIVKSSIVLALWLFLHRYIKSNQNKIKLFAEENSSSNQSTAYISVVFLWAISAASIFTSTLDGKLIVIAQIGYSLSLTIIHVLFVYLNYYLKLRSLQTKYLTESNKMMLETIDDFRGIKHDFNNILQTYDGYFVLEDYEALKKYHQKLRGKTVSAGDRLSLQKTFAESPAILGLILSSKDYADRMTVRLDFQYEEILSRIDLPEFNLCRVLGILFNNAIEHAAQTKAKTVSVSVRSQADSKGIVIIMNSVDSKVNTGDLFNEGYTTKEGHSGHGLVEVNKILNGYYGCTIMPNCTDDTFTMYLSVPMNTRQPKG